MQYPAKISYLFRITLILCLFINIGFGRIHRLKAPSIALTDSNRVIVATPTDFDIKRPDGYPFIVMLHGWTGDETQWEKDADLQGLCDTYNILLILPDGGYDGWWVDSELLEGSDYETHLHEEITIWVVMNFNGSPKAIEHGILGLSMGGFGAFIQALKYPDDYAAAASLSGVMDITRHPEKFGLIKNLGDLTTNPAEWEANNPLHLSVYAAPPLHPKLLLICGRDDFTFAENKEIFEQMKKQGYSINFNEEDGAHTHKFWKKHVGEAVEFIVSNFADH